MILMDEVLNERLAIARERLEMVPLEETVDAKYREYFRLVSEFLLTVSGGYTFVQSDAFLNADYRCLKTFHDRMFSAAQEEFYEFSYLNPKKAVADFGKEMGQVLSVLYAEFLCLIPYAYEKREWDLTIRLELFLEVYGVFEDAYAEGSEVSAETIREILSSFMGDYSSEAMSDRIRELQGVEKSIGEDILRNADLTTPDYLYRYGEYVTENEEKLAAFFAKMPKEDVEAIAKTYSEGFRKGFEVMNKDFSSRKSVQLYYHIGLERMMREAVRMFEAMGLSVNVFRCSVSNLTGRSINKNGFEGARCNRQLEFDHEEDCCLWLDKNYINRRIEAVTEGFESVKEIAWHFAGPAVVEVFGEKNFEPVIKEECVHPTKEKAQLKVESSSKMGETFRKYIDMENRSFTIISFPVPDIGEKFEEIFEETVRVNTLDYELYRDMQQIIIDALDKAEYVEVKGMGKNTTDLRVSLHTLNDPATETNFENCVADVNIPVGEVFTSPVLKGTNGRLHVTKVFLEGLEYRDFFIELKDGMVADYGCGNFDTPKKGKDFVGEYVMFHHDTLPIGEFAIGTNTVAYKMARKYDIAAKMPILIAEKTGPHFAFGDTCYSFEEDTDTFNPDGKRIIAKDNEVTILRKEDTSKAYFNCHTDVTIPYDELGSLTAVKKNGERIDIIVNGKFVLSGLEELNKPLME